MNDLQKMGGIAALIQAATYVVGLGLALTLLAPVLDADPDQYVAFLADNLTLMYVWHLIIYVVTGVFLVVLALGELGGPSLGWVSSCGSYGWGSLCCAVAHARRT